ncbi:hypothetical protein F0562_004756 [Nyssa sinensis]|uniref:Nudix hydrolase domain-containing protein n=1 Tax=Nyssa sinensis TaxID=561372 RepID=A0A5J5AKT6_9ASTE|nr:hypothetical protein F0562_004756 [Nyssa sinensis]
MASLLARTGRHRQRYKDNLRLVSGCIPYRLAKDDGVHNNDLESRLEVLMISLPNRDDLVFPKGGWEDDETVEEAACREVLEEAGVKGILKENHLGVWDFRSKSRQEICSLEGGCRGYMFALQVTEELETWPEQENHDRKWIYVKEAFKFCRYEWMRRALNEFLEVMDEEGKHEMREDVVEPCRVAVSDECQIMSTNCCVKASSTQHPNIRPVGAQFGIMLPGI